MTTDTDFVEVDAADIQWDGERTYDPLEELLEGDDWTPHAELANAIDPGRLDKGEWLKVGQALHEEDHSWQLWDRWCRRDPDRYVADWCADTYDTFRDSTRPFGLGTLARIAIEHGFSLPNATSMNVPWNPRVMSPRAFEAMMKDATFPRPVRFCDVVEQGLPPLAPTLVDGVLRQGHKLTIAGASKAAKSFALIGLAVAIAGGRKWLGWQCAEGPVLYVNFEVDERSCLHRFQDVYDALDVDESENLIVWNLRGMVHDMQTFSRRIIDEGRLIAPLAVIIDPAYKVMGGDENSARDMAAFTNQLDRIATELDCAVIMCHHHSKGAQGFKGSMDRSSGSGVFARDPDALLDFIELDKTPELVKQQLNEAACAHMASFLDVHAPAGWRDEVSQDVQLMERDFRDACVALLGHGGVMNELIAELDELEREVREYKALRIEGTLREFRSFPPRFAWFKHPVHVVDTEGVLSDLQARGEKGAKATPQESKQDREAVRNAKIERAFEACAVDGAPTLKDLAEYLETSDVTARKYVNEHGGFAIEKSVVTRASKEETP